MLTDQAVYKTPRGSIVGRQLDTVDTVIRSAQHHLECRIRAFASGHAQRHRRVFAADAEQKLTRVIRYFAEHLIPAERGVIQRDTVTFRGEYAHRQCDPVGPAATQFEQLHQTGLVHHPEMGLVLLVQVKTVDFLFRHQHLVVAGAIDLECLAAAQRHDLVTRIVLRQLQVPAQTKAAVLAVERVVVKCQWHTRATQSVGLDIGQGDRHRVLPGTGVNAALYITQEVERVGVYGSRCCHDP